MIFASTFLLLPMQTKKRAKLSVHFPRMGAVFLHQLLL